MGAISLRNPIQTEIIDQTAAKTVCEIPGYKTFQTVEFPLELKSKQTYINDTFEWLLAMSFPMNDIELDIRVLPLSKTLQAVHLSWSCPSDWFGIPDVYKIICAKMRPTVESYSNDALLAESAS